MIINGITLKNPDWGDTIKQASSLAPQIYRCRDGATRYTYVRRSGKHLMSMSFSYNLYSDILALFNSLKTNMGQTFDMTDFESQGWENVVILNNPLELTCIGRTYDPTDHTKEGYSMSLDFMGDYAS